MSDLANAVAGRLGHVDPVYTDPAYANAIAAAPQPQIKPVPGEREEPAPVPTPEVVEAPPEIETPAPEESEEDLEAFTVAELKEELDALGIEYDPKARKADLVELVRQAESDS